MVHDISVVFTKNVSEYNKHCLIYLDTDIVWRCQCGHAVNGRRLLRLQVQLTREISTNENGVNNSTH